MVAPSQLEPLVDSTVEEARVLVERVASEAFEAGVAAASGELLTTAQAAERLGLSRAFVYKLARRHSLGVKVGKALMLSRSDVEALENREHQRRRRG